MGIYPLIELRGKNGHGQYGRFLGGRLVSVLGVPAGSPADHAGGIECREGPGLSAGSFSRGLIGTKGK